MMIRKSVTAAALAVAVSATAFATPAFAADPEPKGGSVVSESADSNKVSDFFGSTAKDLGSSTKDQRQQALIDAQARFNTANSDLAKKKAAYDKLVQDNRKDGQDVSAEKLGEAAEKQAAAQTEYDAAKLALDKAKEAAQKSTVQSFTDKLNEIVKAIAVVVTLATTIMSLNKAVESIAKAVAPK